MYEIKLFKLIRKAIQKQQILVVHSVESQSGQSKLATTPVLQSCSRCAELRTSDRSLLTTRIRTINDAMNNQYYIRVPITRRTGEGLKCKDLYGEQWCRGTWSDVIGPRRSSITTHQLPGPGYVRADKGVAVRDIGAEYPRRSTWNRVLGKLRRHLLASHY